MGDMTSRLSPGRFKTAAQDCEEISSGAPKSSMYDFVSSWSRSVGPDAGTFRAQETDEVEREPTIDQKMPHGAPCASPQRSSGLKTKDFSSDQTDRPWDRNSIPSIG